MQDSGTAFLRKRARLRLKEAEELPRQERGQEREQRGPDTRERTLGAVRLDVPCVRRAL